MPHPEEQHLVRQAQNGDRQAFAALVERYWARVFGWLYSLTHNRHAAEDMTQEVFLKVWKALPSLASADRFRSWLFRMARNCWIDRKRGPRGADVQSLPVGLASREPDPAERALTAEAQALLQGACDRLAMLYRVPFLLWTHEDMSFAEIADVLDLTEETARWRVCKARQLLLEELEPYLDRKKTT